jgi:hypothetical protein
VKEFSHADLGVLADCVRGYTGVVERCGGGAHDYDGAAGFHVAAQMLLQECVDVQVWATDIGFL